MDVDSQVEVNATQMSAGESDSESEGGDVLEEVEECSETPYIYSPEPEFGGVSK